MDSRNGYKIYLAAQFSRRDEMESYRTLLESSGNFLVSRWHKDQDNEPLDGSLTNHTDHVVVAVNDLCDVKASDMVLFFSEDPLIGVPRGGRHVEFGCAWALGKRIVVIGPRENIFHWLPGVEHYATIDDFVNSLLK